MLLTSWGEEAVGWCGLGVGERGEQVKLINKKMPRVHSQTPQTPVVAGLGAPPALGSPPLAR